MKSFLQMLKNLGGDWYSRYILGLILLLIWLVGCGFQGQSRVSGNNITYNIIRQDPTKDIVSNHQSLEITPNPDITQGSSNDTTVTVYNKGNAKNIDVTDTGVNDWREGSNNWCIGNLDSVVNWNKMVDHKNNLGCYVIYVKSPQNNTNFANGGLDIRIRYNNIGTYNGRKVGATLKITGFKTTSINYNRAKVLVVSHNFYYGFWLKEATNNYTGTGENNPMDMKYSISLFYTDNGEAINSPTNAFLTFNSLNQNEFAGYLRQNSDNSNDFIQNVDAYVSNDSYIAPANGLTDWHNEWLAYDGNVMQGTNNWFDDYLGGITFYKASVMYPFYGNGDRDWYHSGTGWTTFSSAMILPYAAQPTKQVVDSSGKNIDKQRVRESSIIKYNINQELANKGTAALSTYSSMQFVDKLPDGVTLDIPNVKLFDSKGNNYDLNSSGKLEYDKSTNQVTYTLYGGTDKVLQNSDLYDGRTLTLQLSVIVDLLPTGTSEKEIKNSAHVIINTKDRQTNEVSNIIYDFTQHQPKKYGYGNMNDDSDNNVDGIISRDLGWNYVIEQKINTLGKDINKRYSQFIITDKLDPRVECFHIIAMKNVNNHHDGEPVDENAFTWSVDENNVLTIKFKKWYLDSMDMDGGTYAFWLYNGVKAGVALGTKNIDNQAEVTLGDHEPMKTNIITNPVQPSEATVKKGVENGRLKDNASGSYFNDYYSSADFPNSQDSYLTYTLTATTGDGANRDLVTIDDTLESAFSLTDDKSLYYYSGQAMFGSLQVIKSTRKSVLSDTPQSFTDDYGNNVSVKFDSNTRHLHIEITNPNGVQNYGFKFKYEVKTTAYDNYAKYYANNEIKIPNTFNFVETINDGGKISQNALQATAYAKTSVIKQSVTKTINYNNSSATNMNLKYGDNYNYQIDVQLSNVLTYNNTSINDLLADVISYEGYTFENTTTNQQMPENYVSFKDNKIVAQLPTSKAHKFRLTINAKIDANKANLSKLKNYETSDSIVVPNTAYLSSNNGQNNTQTNSNTVNAILAPIVYVGINKTTMQYGGSGLGAISFVQENLVAPKTSSKRYSNSTVKTSDITLYAGDNPQVLSSYDVDATKTFGTDINTKIYHLGYGISPYVENGYVKGKLPKTITLETTAQKTPTSVYVVVDKDLNKQSVKYDTSDDSKDAPNYNDYATVKNGSVTKAKQLVSHYYDRDSTIDSTGYIQGLVRYYYATSGFKLAKDDDDLMDGDIKSMTKVSAKSGYNIELNTLYGINYWYGDIAKDYLKAIYDQSGTDSISGSFNRVGISRNWLQNPSLNETDWFNDGGSILMNAYFEDNNLSLSQAKQYLKAIDDSSDYTFDELSGLSDALTSQNYEHSNINKAKWKSLIDSTDALSDDKYLTPQATTGWFIKSNLPYTQMVNGVQYFDKVKMGDKYSQSIADNNMVFTGDSKNELTLKNFIKNGVYSISFSNPYMTNFQAPSGQIYATLSTILGSQCDFQEYVDVDFEIYGHRFMTKQDGFNDSEQDEINIQPETSSIGKHDDSTLGKFVEDNSVE